MSLSPQKLSVNNDEPFAFTLGVVEGFYGR